MELQFIESLFVVYFIWDSDTVSSPKLQDTETDEEAIHKVKEFGLKNSKIVVAFCSIDTLRESITQKCT